MTASVHLPKTIHYGRDSFQKVGSEAKAAGSKALLISDEIMAELGFVDTCEQHLADVGVESVRYLGVASEPTDVYVEEALALVERNDCDHIIALGGGSCIDTAKGVAVLATNGGEISAYMNNRRKAAKRALPFIAIPTTAGTGSEATDVTVITNTKNDVKMMIKQPAFMPETAIVDPYLTVTSPRGTTAATGVDALTHALEAYISKKAHPFTDELALSAIERIYASILTAYNDGKNIEARDEMVYAAMQAGMAFSNASVCLVHGMSRPIGALFHVPHGISNAMLLPAVLEFSEDSCRDRLADIGRRLFPQAEDPARVFVDEVIALCRKLDIPNLGGWGIDEAEFEAVLEKMADDAIESGSPGNNPRVPTKDELIDLYRTAFHYSYKN